MKTLYNGNDNHSFCKSLCRKAKRDLREKHDIRINITEIYDDYDGNDSHHTLYFPEPYNFMGTYNACCPHDAIYKAFREIIDKQGEANQ